MKVLLVHRLFSSAESDEWYYVKAIDESKRKTIEFIVAKTGLEQYLDSPANIYNVENDLMKWCFLSISNNDEIVLIHDDKVGCDKLPKILQTPGYDCVSSSTVVSGRCAIKLNNSKSIEHRKKYIAAVLSVIAEDRWFHSVKDIPSSVPKDVMYQFVMHAEVFSYGNITQYHEVLVCDLIAKLTDGAPTYTEEAVLNGFLKTVPSIFAEKFIIDTVTAVEGISAKLALDLCRRITKDSSFRVVAVEKIFNIHFTRNENDKAIEFLLDNPEAFRCPGIAELIPIAFAGWFGFEFGTATMQVADVSLKVDDHVSTKNFFELIQRIRNAIHPVLDNRNLQISELRQCLVTANAEIAVIKAKNLELVGALASTSAVAARVQQTEDLSKQLAESKLQIASLNQVISRLSLLLSNFTVVPMISQLRCEVATQTEFLTQHSAARMVEPEVVEILDKRRAMSAGHRPR